ncbi:MAG: Hpt domain-containing protein [Candidatus Eremiobacterota bacterium]
MQPPFDREAVLDNIDHDEELFREMIDIFLDSQPSLWAELDAAVAAGEPPRVGTVAHSLKGALLTLMAGPSAELARLLEQKGRSGNLDGAETLLADLRRELDRLCDSLQSALKQS